jgi:hypothetical protein
LQKQNEDINPSLLVNLKKLKKNPKKKIFYDFLKKNWKDANFQEELESFKTQYTNDIVW